MINLTYEYRIYPSADQEATMLDWLEQLRRVYNYGLRERKDWIRSRKCEVSACSIFGEYIIPSDTLRPTYINQQNRLTKYRQTSPELQTVHSQVLQGALRQVDEAFKNMWEKGFGFPRFKKTGRMRSFVFPQLGKNPVRANAIKLPSYGWVKVVLHRPIPEGFVIKQTRIVNRAVGWYAMLSLEMDVNVPESIPHGHAIGIDLGLNIIATSDGELIGGVAGQSTLSGVSAVARPRFFVNLQRELELLRRRLKNKKKGSKNWLKLQQKIGRLHQKISNTRKDYHFKTANHLCNDAGMIFAEDLNLRAMSKGMLCKHTLSAGFGQFLTILAWVCWKRGVYFAKVAPNGASQTCPRCDAHVPKDLDVRVHNCPECRYRTDRDVAAAQVIVGRGISAAGLVVDKLPVDGSGSGVRTKQESLEAILGSPRYTACG